MENIPFPDKVVGWYDIAKGVGEVVFHAVFDQIRHPVPSEHFITDAVAPDGIIPKE